MSLSQLAGMTNQTNAIPDELPILLIRNSVAFPYNIIALNVAALGALTPSCEIRFISGLKIKAVDSI